MPLAAGVEKAIPATKSFTCQLAVLYLLALYEGARLGRMDAAALARTLTELRGGAGKIESALDGWREQMAALATKYTSAATFLYLGRGIHYAIAREGALKLKEASYVHAEGYPVGELKHGPNALVSDSVPLVVLATVDRGLEASVMRYEKTLQLLADMKEQGAKVIAIANEGDARVAGLVTRLRARAGGVRVSAADSRSGSAAAVRVLYGAGARRGRGQAEEPVEGCGGEGFRGLKGLKQVLKLCRPMVFPSGAKVSA